MGSHKPKKPWVKPEVKQIRAGSAELGAPQGPVDGQISYS
jgi:hypothetical protein